MRKNLIYREGAKFAKTNVRKMDLKKEKNEFFVFLRGLRVFAVKRALSLGVGSI
jgi:hypothetical protein